MTLQQERRGCEGQRIPWLASRLCAPPEEIQTLAQQQEDYIPFVSAQPVRQQGGRH